MKGKMIYTLIIGMIMNLTASGQQNGLVFPEYYLHEEQAWVDSVYSQLDPDQRIAQLIHIAGYSNKNRAYGDSLVAVVERFQLGGITFFQGGPVRQARLTNRLQEVSDVPLMISMDGEWGLGMRLDSTISYPFQMTLGAVQDEQLIYEMGREIGRQCRELGVHVNFAPVVDVNNNPANPVINFRSFGEDKNNVLSKGKAYMNGLQDAGILSVAKHFPGHGDTDVDSHYDLPVIPHSYARLDSIELYPFKEIIKEGIGGIMVAHLNIPALDPAQNKASTLSRPIVEGLLKDSLGFEGIAFTDALNMEGVAKYYEPGEVEKEAFIAGNDALLLPANVELSIAAIKQAIDAGEITLDEIEDRCRKMLKIKYRLGLAELKPVNVEGLADRLNTGEAELLKRRLLKASLTVIRNDDVIPLKGLDTLRIAAVSVGVDQATEFQKTLGMYTRVDTYQLPADPGMEQIPELTVKLKDYNLVILGMHEQSRYPRNREIYNDEIRSFYKYLAQSTTPLITALFRNPYTLANFKEDLRGSEGVIVAYQKSETMESLAAQLIFGAIGADGTLPVTPCPEFPAGWGLRVSSSGRLAYSIPEDAGIEGQWLRSQVESIIQQALDSMAFPGCQVLLAKNGKVIFHKAYGFHTYDKQREVDLQDLYDFASVTKITGPLPCLMKLHDDRKFSLEASIGDYIPYFDRGNKKEIDFRNILAHQGRLIPYINYWRESLRKSGKFKWFTFKPDSSKRFPYKITEGVYMHRKFKKKIYRHIRKSDLLEDKDHTYSGLSFILYPEIIGNLSGQDFQTYLKENFYYPLGAYNITYRPREYFDPDRIVPTEYDSAFRHELVHGQVHDEAAAVMRGISGNAGLFGNVNDLAKLIEMYRKMGYYGGEQYISKYTLLKFSTCQYCELGNRRGLGFDKPRIARREGGFPSPSASIASFGHSGFTGAFTWADPSEEGTLMVFLSNRVHPTRDNRKVYRLDIYQRLHDLLYNYEQIRE